MQLVQLKKKNEETYIILIAEDAWAEDDYEQILSKHGVKNPARYRWVASIRLFDGDLHHPIVGTVFQQRNAFD
jgi:hypothetical protein